MKRKERKNMSLYRLQALAIILGFTFAFLTVGCAAGGLVGLLVGKAVDLAGWSGIFGLAGFFVGVVVTVQLR